jgi:hypothetical protein
MKTTKNILPVITGSILLGAIILLSVTGNQSPDIQQMTLPELYSRLHGYSYLVTGLLIVYGISLICAGWRFCNNLAFRKFMLLLFGSSFVAASLFLHLSQYEGFSGQGSIMMVHRYFAGMSMISFVMLVVSIALASSDDYTRNISILAGVAIIVSVIFQSESLNAAGLWQKLIIVIISAWFAAISRNGDLSIHKEKTYKVISNRINN